MATATAQRQKTIYRDNATNRLITKKEAGQRDPSSWTEEAFTFSRVPDSELADMTKHQARS